MYNWSSQGMGGAWWVLIFIAMIFFVILVIGLIALPRHDRTGLSAQSPQIVNGSAIDLLKGRLARGELSEEEYSRMLKILKGEA